jgi:Cof subfamily protein (haloacid dehalogenase superfamily)
MSHKYHCNKNDIWLEYYKIAVGVDANLVIDRPMSQFVEENEIGAVKVLAMVEPEKVDKVIEILNAKNFKNCNVVKSAEYLVEVISTDFSKGTALEFIANYYGIPLEQTIAIGDQHNDVPMIEKAGLGFAVKNADETLKKVAKVSQYTNDENAVAHLIEEYAYME